jgi:hypothetical protein
LAGLIVLKPVIVFDDEGGAHTDGDASAPIGRSVAWSAGWPGSQPLDRRVSPSFTQVLLSPPSM